MDVFERAEEWKAKMLAMQQSRAIQRDGWQIKIMFAMRDEVPRCLCTEANNEMTYVGAENDILYYPIAHCGEYVCELCGAAMPRQIIDLAKINMRTHPGLKQVTITLDFECLPMPPSNHIPTTIPPAIERRSDDGHRPKNNDL